MNWYLDCWKKYATFAGRARRKEHLMMLEGSRGANRYGEDPKEGR